MEHYPTDRANGGALLYVKEDPIYKLKNDLKIFKSRGELESIFIEIINSTYKNVIVSSIVNEVIRTILDLLNFFYEKKITKTQIKPKQTSKTKISEHETTKATAFCTRKLLRGGKLFILHFGAFVRIKLKK